MASRSLESAHALTSFNRMAVEASTTCACGYCHARFAPGEIRQWTDWPAEVPFNERSDANGQTAICPYCSVDAVLPGSAGFDLGPAFLESFRQRWF